MKQLYVANWKMQRSFTQECTLAQEYLSVAPLAKQNSAQLVLCPSFPALDAVKTILSGSPDLLLGAQNCSGFSSGAYTGQVSARSLAEVGCSYCIVGHNERQNFETSTQVAKKVAQLVTNKIIPIVCTGENQEQHKNNQTLKVIERQLKPTLETLGEHSKLITKICIAYEPVWSIGTGIVPDQDHLTRVFSFINSLAGTFIPVSQLTLLYGGSVDEENLNQLGSNPLNKGFLIGSASLDIQKLKKIVSS